jgi:hypothetical protein
VAQELSTLVFPSEDEISEALELGLIDSTEAAALIETLQLGLDPGSYHRYDLIPNLSYIYSDKSNLYDLIRLDQKSFLNDLHNEDPSGISGEVWFESYQELNEENRSRYRTGFNLFADQHWSAGARVNKEYSGAERIVDRKLSYQNKQGVVKEIILGSFSRRYGLGTAIGYRGKLFDYSDEIDDESMLYPDYGGFNGLHAEIGSDNLTSMTIVSSQRDSKYRLQTYGEFVTHEVGRLRLGLFGVVNHLTNRTSDMAFDDIKLGLFGFRKYKDGKVAVETSLQQGDRQSFGALAAEGRHNFDHSRFGYSLWHYDDQFVDLSAGSKSANIRHVDSLDQSTFAFSTRRSGQSGALVKNLTSVSKKTRLSNSVLSAWLNADTVLIEMVSAVEHDLNHDISLRIDYSNRYRKHVTDDKIEHKARAELRIRSGKYRIRSYIGYNRKVDGTDYLLLFGTFNIDRGRLGQWHLWADLSRLNLAAGALDYAYVYVEHIRRIESWLAGRVKLSERYNRNATEKYLTTMSFELTLLI